MSHLFQFCKNIRICKMKEVFIQHLVYDFMQVHEDVYVCSCLLDVNRSGQL